MNCRIWAVSFLVSFREYTSFCKVCFLDSGKTQKFVFKLGQDLDDGGMMVGGDQ